MEAMVSHVEMLKDNWSEFSDMEKEIEEFNVEEELRVLAEK
jgi:hypothetical protein